MGKTLPCTCGSENFSTKCVSFSIEEGVLFEVHCNSCGNTVVGHGETRNEALLNAVSNWNGDRAPMSHDQRIIAYLANKLAKMVNATSSGKPVTPADIIELAEHNIHS